MQTESDISIQREAMRGLRHNRVICLASLVLLLQVALAASKHDHHDTSSKHDKKEISRKSIVFDSKTPNVFYCPQEKPTDVGKMIVKAKPLDKLCEFGGKSKPKGEPTDCYNDVDETQFACDEKRRFLVSQARHAAAAASAKHRDDL